jgi:hypothetical protein
MHTNTERSGQGPNGAIPMHDRNKVTEKGFFLTDKVNAIWASWWHESRAKRPNLTKFTKKHCYENKFWNNPNLQSKQKKVE